MNASFGIDHPLIAINDIELVRSRFEKMGFRMTAIGKHPWGTSTSLAMFEGSLIEIMGIYDDNLLDVNPAGDFHFGQHIHQYLSKREGVALSALHSTDIASDIEHAKDADLDVSGTLEFGRDVTLPDGGQDRTKTTLALLPDAEFPRLSFFLCQQHRPDLIYVPEWMDHANTVYSYAGITIQADLSQHAQLRKKFNALYGEVTARSSGFSVESANGRIQVQTKEATENEFGNLPSALKLESEASIVALDFYCESLKVLQSHIINSELPYKKISSNPYNGNSECILLSDPSLTGNTYFRFIERKTV